MLDLVSELQQNFPTLYFFPTITRYPKQNIYITLKSSLLTNKVMLTKNIVYSITKGLLVISVGNVPVSHELDKCVPPQVFTYLLSF